MPWVIRGLVMHNVIARLPAGVTLLEVYPNEFPPPVPAPVVATPLLVPPVAVMQPVASPSALLEPTLMHSLDTSSSFRSPTLVLVPPARTSLCSPAALLPAQTPSPVVPPISLCSPLVGFGVGPAPPSTPGSMPSPSVPLPLLGSSCTIWTRCVAPAALAAPAASTAPDATKSAWVSPFLFFYPLLS